MNEKETAHKVLSKIYICYSYQQELLYYLSAYNKDVASNKVASLGIIFCVIVIGKQQT